MCAGYVTYTCLLGQRDGRSQVPVLKGARLIVYPAAGIALAADVA